MNWVGSKTTTEGDHHGNNEYLNGHLMDIFDVIYHDLGARNHVLEMKDLNQLLTDLHLKHCQDNIADCNTCFDAHHLLSWYKSTAPISEADFEIILPGFLYILTHTSRNCSKQTNAGLDTKNTLKVFEDKYGSFGDDNEHTENNLENMLESVNQSFGKYLNKGQCFTVHDILEENHLENGITTIEDLRKISGYVMLQVFNQRCIQKSGNHVHKNLPKSESFVANIFHEFGRNDSYMNHEGFEKLYNVLQLGNTVHKHGGEEDHHHKKRKRRETSHDLLNECYESDDILDIYGVHGDDEFDATKFQEICPSLIVQLEKKSCGKKKKEQIKTELETESWKPWVAMFVSVAIVSFGSLSGIIAAPVSKKKWFPYLIMALISLAVATLIGDAILHLFPHAVGLHKHEPGDNHHHGEDGHNPLLAKDSFLWKSIALLGGIYVFFMFEILMHAYGGGHSHSHGVENHVKSASTNNSLRVKGTLGMSEDTSVVYNTRIKSNSILRPSGLHQCTPEINNGCQSSSCSDDSEDKSTCSSAQENLSVEETITFPSSTDLHIPCSESHNVLVIDDFHHEHDKMNKAYGNHDNHQRHHKHHSEDSALSPRKLTSIAWMVLIGDAIHNFLDGIAIGVAFAEGWPDGLHGGISTSIAILCHELPHELGDFAVLLNSGLSIKNALIMNFISSLTAFIGGILGVSLGTHWEASNWIFAITAGLFIYIALVDMLPEILHSSNLKLEPAKCIFLANIGLMVGFGIMIVLGAWEEDIKTVLKH